MVRVLPAARIIRLRHAPYALTPPLVVGHTHWHISNLRNDCSDGSNAICWARDFLIQFHRVSPLSNQDSNCVISKWNKKGTSSRFYILARSNRILERYLKIYIHLMKREKKYYSFAALSAQYIPNAQGRSNRSHWRGCACVGVCTYKRPIRNDLLPVDIAFIISFPASPTLFAYVYTHSHYMCVCRVWWRCVMVYNIFQHTYTKDESNELCAKSTSSNAKRSARGGSLYMKGGAHSMSCSWHIPTCTPHSLEPAQFSV